ncbi:MAG: CPBP family intramembrane glutamic endopeptidase [Pseudomonadota bacterium]
MADPYAPNRHLTGYLRAPGPAQTFVITALGVYLAWFVLRQTIFVLFGEETAWGANNFGFAINLLFFAVLIALMARAVRAVHGLNWRYFLGDSARLVADFTSVFAACALVYAVVIIIGWDPSSATMQPFGAWLAFLPIALICILIQTGAEELFFRGYLHHFCTIYLKRPILWLLVPSALFGATHIFNDLTSPSSALAYVIWTTAFGVACVDLTARSGSLGAAWGLHMAVNTAALTIAGTQGAPVSGAALYLFPERSDEFEPVASMVFLALIFELLFLFVLWLAARNAIRR